MPSQKLLQVLKCNKIINGFGGVRLQCAVVMEWPGGRSSCVLQICRELHCGCAWLNNKFLCVCFVCMLCIGDPHTTKGAATSDPISPCHKHASSSIKWSYPYERACMRRARVILYKCCVANESEWMSESEWVLLVQLLCALPLQLLPCWRVVRLEKTLTLSLAHRFVNATHTGVTIPLWFHSRALKTPFELSWQVSIFVSFGDRINKNDQLHNDRLYNFI